MGDARDIAGADPLEPLARAICCKLGLNPDDHVEAGVLDIRTAKERQDFGPFIPDVCLYVPRWQLFRAKADEARAGFEALREMEQKGA